MAQGSWHPCPQLPALACRGDELAQHLSSCHTEQPECKAVMDSGEVRSLAEELCEQIWHRGSATDVLHPTMAGTCNRTRRAWHPLVHAHGMINQLLAKGA